ncbi:MAG: hypothetical protein ABII25_10230 [bacterium]
MDKEKLKLLIDESRSNEPSKITLGIYEYIKKHKNIVLNSYGPFVKDFEDSFQELTLVIDYLNYVPSDKWENHKKFQNLLYPEALKTLHCSFEILINGYYDESIMLCRSAYETFFRIIFLSCYPKEWEAIFVDRKGKIQFNVTSFCKDHLNIDWEFIYKIMCLMSHSKNFRNMEKLKKIWEKKAKEKITLIYSLNEDSLKMAINNIILTLSCLFHIIIPIFEEDLQNYIGFNKVIKRDLILLGIIEDTKSDFSALSKDIVKIGKIIKIANSGGDWEKVAGQVGV